MEKQNRAQVILSRPWSQIVKIRGLMCSDGVRRTTQWCGTPDTFFSLPCHVKVKGKTVSGFATQFRRADDSHDWQFHAMRAGRNGARLPDRSIYAVTRNGCGAVNFSEPAGYLSAKVGDVIWTEESGEICEIRTIWPDRMFSSPWRMEFARDDWTWASDVT